MIIYKEIHCKRYKKEQIIEQETNHVCWTEWEEVDHLLYLYVEKVMTLV